MLDKTNIILSSLVDATVKEQQPDVDFKMFRNLEQFGTYLEHDAIRASVMFVTSDVIVQPNNSFSYLLDILHNNNFIKVDSVVYITQQGSPEIKALRYLLDQFGDTTWDIIECQQLTRAYVTEVVNGTFRGDSYRTKRKAVIRMPRREYIKQQMRNNPSLEEDYEDDDTSMMHIPDVEVPADTPVSTPSHIKKIHIVGDCSEERSAFTLLAAQYLSLSGKTILIESDPEYHTLTEFVTKSEVSALIISIETLLDNPGPVLERVKVCEDKLIIFTCVARIQFSYKFLCDLIFYTLYDHADYMLVESEFKSAPIDVPMTVVIPNTVIGCLKLSEQLDPAVIDSCSFVGVSFGQVPEVHVNSGTVLTNIIRDILSTETAECTVIEVSSLRISNTPYDMGAVLKGE